MKEILLYNYWEHFKSAKELSMVLPANHPRLIAINKVANELLEKIHSIPESLFIS